MDDTIDLSRAEQAQPGGYNAHRITEPPADAAWEQVLTYVPEDPADMPCVLPQRVVESIAASLARMEFAADMVTAQGKPEANAVLADAVASEARRLRVVLRGFLGGAAVLALALVALVAAPGASPAAQAAEAPQPDPGISATYRVTLGAAPVTVYVRASVYTPTAPGWFCGSVWTARGRIGGTCSISATFPIPLTIDPRTFPAGRTLAQVVDDASDAATTTIVFDARRPSRFDRGTWTPTPYGDGLAVTAPLYAYTASRGAWTPQQASPVQVQELVAGRWVTRATLTTNRYGIASGSVILGGGLHTVRVARPAGKTVWATVGTRRTFQLMPTDVPDGVI